MARLEAVNRGSQLFGLPRWQLPRRMITRIVILCVVGGLAAMGIAWGTSSGIERRLGIVRGPTVAYAHVAGRIARIDPITGAVLARSSDFSGDQFPSLAASPDGQSVFVLHHGTEGGRTGDWLVTLSATNLAVEAAAPLQHYMRPMDAWPPALAITPDGRTVVVEQYGYTEADPYWLSYYDRRTGTFTSDRTDLPGCGVAQLLPVGQQLAVVCLTVGDLRLVDLRSHRVTATLLLTPSEKGVFGSPVAAGVLPGSSELAVVDDHGNLLRADLVHQVVRLVATLVPASDTFPPVTAAAFSANGRVAVLLAPTQADRSIGRAQTLLIVDAANGQIRDRMPIASQYGAVSLSPDGQRLFVIGEHDRLQWIDLTTRQVRAFGPDPSHTWVHLAYP